MTSSLSSRPITSGVLDVLDDPTIPSLSGKSTTSAVPDPPKISFPPGVFSNSGVFDNSDAPITAPYCASFPEVFSILVVFEPPVVPCSPCDTCKSLDLLNDSDVLVVEPRDAVSGEVAFPYVPDVTITRNGVFAKSGSFDILDVPISYSPGIVSSPGVSNVSDNSTVFCTAILDDSQ